MARGRRQNWDFIDVVDQEEAERITAPHVAMMRNCIEEGFRAVEAMASQHPEFFRVYPAGPRATLVYWQIVHRAETQFSGVEWASVSTNRGFLTIVIGDKLEIRFKKLDGKGRSKNYPTKAQVRYSLQLRLPGMEEPTRATAGYQLNLDGTLKDILMVCPRGKQLEWSFSLPVDSSDLVAHPAAPATRDEDQKPMVRPKQA